jgi:hypothetical protein
MDKAVQAGIAKATHVYCDKVDDIRPLQVSNSELRCAECGFVVAPLYMSDTGQRLTEQSLTAATHILCPGHSAVVPLLFEGFTGAAASGKNFVGGDIVCPDCYFIIGMLWRMGAPEELRRARSLPATARTCD